ncbi:MAG: GTP pyrophosphokinase [Eubacterium sp.]|nr:GTP pyrophosphokinase [Eubacterium sp.]
MIYTDLTRLAMKIAYEAHHGQVDRQGIPYIYHPIHLAEQMTTEDTCVVALLHDVIEDTDITLDDLRNYGFTEVQIEAVGLLTHDVPDPSLSYEDKEKLYLDYVTKAGQNSIAREVKIADLKHNSDRTRLVLDTEIDEARYGKYKKALEILESIED